MIGGSAKRLRTLSGFAICAALIAVVMYESATREATPSRHVSAPLAQADAEPPQYVWDDARRAAAHFGGMAVPVFARLVRSAGSRLWWVEGKSRQRTSTCLVRVPSGAAACAPTGVASQFGLAIGVSLRGDDADAGHRNFLLAGMAPRGVQQVRVEILGSGSALLTVKRRIYGLKAQAPVIVKQYCPGPPGDCVPVREWR